LPKAAWVRLCGFFIGAFGARGSGNAHAANSVSGCGLMQYPSKAIYFYALI
jgi:hypothetical protein